MKNQNKSMRSWIQICVLALVLTSCGTNPEQEEKLNFEPFSFETDQTIQKGQSLPTQKGLSPFVETTIKSNPVCQNLPTLEQVKLGKWTFTDQFYTLRQAYKLGIPIARVDFSKNITVYVRDYMRAEPCTSSDGTTRLKYGQVIRTVIEIEDFDASSGVDLASIAASGTINKKKQSFYLYKDGFYNPQIDQIISSVSGKVFDVENYALYQSVMTQMINLLSKPETQFAVNLIGVEAKIIDDIFLEEASIITYTLSRIEKGKSCIEIKNTFENNPKAIELIERTFNAMELKCDETEPTAENKLKAKRLLQGIKVR
jgi:hypothetical protein